MTHRTMPRSALAFVVTLLLSATAQAQLFRAYLAPTGSDSSPCTLQAPCRLLPAALAAVADGGEIWMLQSANYNNAPVNITKSVTILAVPGVVGSVVATGGNAINIATAGVEVALRNLVIVPLPGGGGNDGIDMNDGAVLTVENCLFANLPGNGIWVQADAVRVTETTIRDNGNVGLSLRNGARATITRAMISGNAGNGVTVLGNVASTTTTADMADSTVDGNNSGVIAYSSHESAVVKVSLHGSRIVRNANFGVGAQSEAGASVTLAASQNVISSNATGLGAIFSGARVWASGNTVSDNTVFGLSNNASLFESAGNNAVRNNGLNKTGSITVIATE